MGLNKRIIHWIDGTFYGNVTDRWDDKLLRDCVLKYLFSEAQLLDVGSGRGRLSEMDFRGYAKRIEGVDPDPLVIANPFLHKGHVGVGESMPFFTDNEFDVIISDNVLEHVENPNSFYKEIFRVLKKGGIFITKTPNKYNHVAVIAGLTPLGFHKFINKLRGRDYTDTFPTFYRANTKKSQLKYAAEVGLKIMEIEYIMKRDEYLRITFFTYFIGLLYERIVNFFNIRALKTIIITVMVK